MRAYYLIVIAAGLLSVGDAVRATAARHSQDAERTERRVQEVARIGAPSVLAPARVF